MVQLQVSPSRSSSLQTWNLFGMYGHVMASGFLQFGFFSQCQLPNFLLGFFSSLLCCKPWKKQVAGKALSITHTLHRTFTQGQDLYQWNLDFKATVHSKMKTDMSLYDHASTRKINIYSHLNLSDSGVSYLLYIYIYIHQCVCTFLLIMKKCF